MTVSWPPRAASMTASRPLLSCLPTILPSPSFTSHWQSISTTSVHPQALASIRGVWWSSFRLVPSRSWPRSRRSLTISAWPNDAARWREVLELPSPDVAFVGDVLERNVGAVGPPGGEMSGLWIRDGWERRMRCTSEGLLAWIARRRRRSGSILWRRS